MIRLIQTLFAVACILLIAGFHFNNGMLTLFGSITMVGSWILLIMTVSLIKEVVKHTAWSEANNIL